MRLRNIELWLALITIIILTCIYILVVWVTGSIPAASAFFGHSLGILGFMLMLMTEMLYSLRKRSRRVQWGRMSSWLKFHIFTGIVGPYMVLLHSSWKFNGLAGIVMLFTVVIVISGFIGRYIYTAVPRTADGIQMEAQQIEQVIAATEEKLKHFQDTQPGLRSRFIKEMSRESSVGEKGVYLAIGQFFMELGNRFWWWQQKRQLRGAQRRKSEQLEQLIRRRRVLRRQVTSLAMMRRMLSIWHTAHIPIGIVLFTTAFIHILTAVYYATFIH